ncbi:MAG: DNA polymerase IV [Candidatus Obscuribacterales bacterium]|nr:DNA polymerase IV [Candidatus Obscuribacterales bacterium]
MDEAALPVESSNAEPQKVRKIIHMDMDAFYASVEQRDNPELRGRPVVVGGLPDQRGVVATASYEARQFGIHSAMPSITAFRKCPNATFLRPRFEVYKSVSEQIREIFERYSDLVEPLSLDEAYIDVTTNKKDMPSATLIAREIRAAIFAETELTASAGVSVNKFLAKTASGIKKPNGLYLIAPETAEEFVASLAINKFYGIGDVTAEKMRTLGIRNGADLRQWTEIDLVRKFGRAGSYYYQIARARDDRPVVANRTRKSVGAEESFTEDLSDREAMDAALLELAQIVSRRLEKSNTAGRTVTLKVKYADYNQITRSRTLNASVSKSDELARIASDLLSGTEVLSRRARLLGITVSNLDSEESALSTDCLQLTLGMQAD